MAERSRTGRWIRAILVLQLIAALYLVGRDVADTAALSGWGAPRAPAFDTPIAPGDQTRRFRPEDRQRVPGTQRPFDMPDDIPERLQFEPDPDTPGTLRLFGAIAPRDADRFAAMLKDRETPPDRILLNSPGGSVTDALAIGKAIRDLAAVSEVPPNAICLSACPYIFAGGSERTVAATGILGVHQHFFDENTALPAFLVVRDIQRGQGAVMTHLIDMGVDPRMMQHALATPPEDIYVFTPEELTKYTWITPEPTTEPDT